MRILVFLHGTVIMHRNAVGKTREERVRQSVVREESIWEFESYIPIGEAARKLHGWKRQGAEILYMSSHRALENVEKDRLVLERHSFPEGPVFFRLLGEDYKDVAERLLPDVIIEDDCESIGGEREMVYPRITPELKTRIRSVVVREFGGIDHVPDRIDELASISRDPC